MDEIIFAARLELAQWHMRRGNKRAANALLNVKALKALGAAVVP